MIVADTSALVSVATAEVLETVVAEFDIHTTERVVSELRDTAEYGDRHGTAAADVLDHLDDLTVHSVETAMTTARIDAGEGSCVVLTDEIDAPFLLTDDLRALPELENATDAQVAISPLLLRALVTRGELDRATARDRLDVLARRRDWLGAPIYRRAKRLFEE